MVTVFTLSGASGPSSCLRWAIDQACGPGHLTQPPCVSPSFLTELLSRHFQQRLVTAIVPGPPAKSGERPSGQKSSGVGGYLPSSATVVWTKNATDQTIKNRLSHHDVNTGTVTEVPPSEERTLLHNHTQT